MLLPNTECRAIVKRNKLTIMVYDNKYVFFNRNLYYQISNAEILLKS